MTPQLYPRKDAIGNVHHVGVTYDDLGKYYVGGIRAGRYRKMMDGSFAQDIAIVGTGSNPSEAADKAIEKWNERKTCSITSSWIEGGAS